MTNPRPTDSQREDARNLRDQANAMHTANAINNANAGNNLAVGLLLGFLAIGALIGIYFMTQTNSPSPSAPPVIQREINNTETNNTTIDRTERTQELVPVPQDNSAPEAPPQNAQPDPVSPDSGNTSN